jgi:hypothetical protein
MSRESADAGTRCSCDGPCVALVCSSSTRRHIAFDAMRESRASTVARRLGAQPRVVVQSGRGASQVLLSDREHLDGGGRVAMSLEYSPELGTDLTSVKEAKGTGQRPTDRQGRGGFGSRLLQNRAR